MKLKPLHAALLLALIAVATSAAHAATIVQWGAQGGDTGVVTSTGSGPVTPSTYTASTLYNPSGTLGYNDTDPARTNKFSGAATKNQNNNFVENANGDYIQLLANMGTDPDPATRFYEGMLAWDGGAGGSGQSAFLTNDGQLESFHVEFVRRGTANTPTVSFLLETTAGWYISDQSATNSSSTYTVFDANIASLTWTGFSQFGVSAGVGAPDTTDFVSVGFYLSDTNDTTNTFSGGYIRNFEVTATAIPEPSSTALLGLGGLAFALRRRRA